LSGLSSIWETPYLTEIAIYTNEIRGHTIRLRLVKPWCHYASVPSYSVSCRSVSYVLSMGDFD